MTKPLNLRRALFFLWSAILLFFLAATVTRVALPSDAYAESTPVGMHFRFNPLMAGLFLLTLGMLFLPRFRFLNELRDILLHEKAVARSFSGAKLVAHLGCIGVIVLYTLLAFFDFAFSVTFPIVSRLLIVLATLAVAAVLIEGLLLQKDISFARMFWLIFVLIGSALVLALPPTLYLSWDDEFHFAHMAYPGIFLAGGEIPLSLKHLLETPFIHPNFFADTESFTTALLEMDSLSESFPSFALPDLHPLLWVLAAPIGIVYAVYRYLVYLPGIIICFFGFLSGSDILLILVACRLCSLLVSATVYAFAIRRLLYGKHLFALCALLPTALYLSANLSCDPFINSFLALAFAYFIGELQRPEKPLSVKSAVIMLGALAIGCAPKPIYFVLFAAFLFLPKTKFADAKTARRFRIATLITAAAVMVTILIPLVINPGAYSDVRGGEDVSASEQIKYILSAPLAYADTLFTFLCETFSLTVVAPYVVFFAYLGQGKSMIGSIYLVLLLFVAICDRSKREQFDLSVHPLPKTITLLSAFAAIPLIATALYISFTPVGINTVLGCQFRYFFPLFPIILYFLGSIKLRSFVSERALALLSLGGGALLNIHQIYASAIAPLAL